MKKSALAAGLKAAAIETHEHQPRKPKTKKLSETVLVGAHFPREVRRTLLLVQAEPDNAGKNLKQLLGEAINDLCAKYRKPQPYTGEA
jgi:hypothetical protein